MHSWFGRIFPDTLSRPVRLLALLIFALHLGFSLFFVFAIPRDGGPDEGAHFAYVRQLAQERALPVLTDPRATRDSRTGAIAQHPPLTYLLGLPFYIAGNGASENVAARAVRLLPVLWGAGTLLVFWVLLRQNFPNRPHFWLAALAVGALWPHFLLLSSVWNNDGLLIFLSALFLWRFPALTREKSAPREWIGLGVLWGLLLLTKATALLYCVPVALVLGWQLVRKNRDFASSLGALSAFALPGILIGGWWFARFYFMIGRIQPIPDLGYEGLLLRGPLDLILHPDAPILAGRFVAGAMRSIWSQVDWIFSPPQRDAMNQTYEFWPAFWGPTLSGQPGMFALTLWLYRVAIVLTGISALGLIAGAARRRLEAPIGILALFFALLYGALGAYTLFKHPGFFEGGRYLLPALPAFAALWVWGIQFWFPARAQKWLAPALIAFFVVLNVGCAVNLTQVLVPLYAPK